MLKKLLAGLTAIALSLGMVALTAAPAGATPPATTTTGESTPVDTTPYVLVAWVMPGWANSTTPTWPQTYFTSIDLATKDLNALDGQLGACGVDYQVDLYNDSPTTTALIAGGVLNGPNNPAEDFPSPSGWGKTYKLINNADCVKEATPTKPTIVQAVCTGEEQVGQGSFTIPAINDIQYKIWDGNSWENISAGVYPADDGDEVRIRAYPATTHVLTDTDHNKEYKSYTLKFDNIKSKNCDVPETPTFTPKVCTGPATTNTASYTIPVDSGIQYQVRINGGSWVDVSAGTVNVVNFPRLIEVQALADGGIIVPGSTTYWSQDFTDPGQCLEKATPGDPKFVDSICEANTTGSTQATYEIVAAPHVTYQISFNGVDY
ncbi:MAG: hypothetical protein WBL06_08845, partial [Pseudolysinimonas sp.]|uniref:hypothetical protein n=1 Tax=Pseudolysinimonas sp. TaxID=2680009 RepID=UPI003C71ECFB